MAHDKNNGVNNQIASLLLPRAVIRLIRRYFIWLCLFALLVSVCIVHADTRNDLMRTCSSVSSDFSSIMQSYKHSFRLFEKLLQREIHHLKHPDAIEAFLKEQDSQLLAIEGGDYDGIYMYYKDRYLYSWDIPIEVYLDSGYDAKKRPWYIGAVQANGELFFSVPYPSYANDYMLATISRLQPDGETVIAYDIKLGAISEFVDRLDIYNGALTLICDTDGNVIGSTEHMYLGGNYSLSDDELDGRIASAKSEYSESDAKSVLKLNSVTAQRDFFNGENTFLDKLISNPDTLRYSLKDFSFGYADRNDEYSCIVISPLTKLLPKTLVVWGASSFVAILAAFLIVRAVSRSNQIFTDTLTGLNNRRSLLKYCENHITHHPNESICFVMLDLNDFKKINDRVGYVVGDHALLDTADALKKSCAEAPNHCFLCRYGGDEFLFAGSNYTQDDIDRLIASIEKNLDYKNKHSNAPYVLNASIGVASGICNSLGDAELLLTKADKVMYDQKEQWRNRQ